MLQYALTELFWVSVILGIPALIAWFWMKHDEREARRRSSFTLVQLSSEGWPARQKRKDDHIFKTMEEYRRDVDQPR